MNNFNIYQSISDVNTHVENNLPHKVFKPELYTTIPEQLINNKDMAEGRLISYVLSRNGLTKNASVKEICNSLRIGRRTWLRLSSNFKKRGWLRVHGTGYKGKELIFTLPNFLTNGFKICVPNKIIRDGNISVEAYYAILYSIKKRYVPHFKFTKKLISEELGFSIRTQERVWRELNNNSYLNDCENNRVLIFNLPTIGVVGVDKICGQLTPIFHNPTNCDVKNPTNCARYKRNSSMEIRNVHAAVDNLQNLEVSNLQISEIEPLAREVNVTEKELVRKLSLQDKVLLVTTLTWMQAKIRTTRNPAAFLTAAFSGKWADAAKNESQGTVVALSSAKAYRGVPTEQETLRGVIFESNRNAEIVDEQRAKNPNVPREFREIVRKLSVFKGGKS